MSRRLPLLIAAAALVSCGGDPVESVREAATLCPSEQPFADLVAANVSQPGYRVADDGRTVRISGRVIYLGDPVEIGVALEDDEPLRFTVNSPPLTDVPSEVAVGAFCDKRLALLPAFGARERIAERVSEAEDAQQTIARLMLIEDRPPETSVAAEFSNRESFRVIEGATLEIPLSDIFLGLPRPVIHMVPRQANRTLFFSCMTDLPFELYPLLPEDCQNPLDPDFGEE